MLFSCKITHSVLLTLDRRGEDLTPVYEVFDWPSEFLHDPSSWLEADKMEKLLTVLEKQFGRAPGVENDLITDVGHQCKDLRAWGVLDSVLRMVQTPKDFFAQPERFLSYFVSPAPPIGELKRESDSVGFVLPISQERFPLVTRYLGAVLEALPTYIGKPMASVEWQESHVSIKWTDRQESLFGDVEKSELTLNPELVESILHNLEKSQKELEETKQRLRARETELDVLRASPAVPLRDDIATSNIEAASTQSVSAALHELYRLGDYFARGQQLITLLTAQGRDTAQVREAMRRVDWPFVCETAPAAIREAISQLQTAQTHLSEEREPFASVPKCSERTQPSLFATSTKRMFP